MWTLKPLADATETRVNSALLGHYFQLWINTRRCGSTQIVEHALMVTRKHTVAH